jgi:hypothetical protein
MNVRQTLILVVVFLLGVLTAGAFIARPVAADTPPLAAPPAAAGRYQMSFGTVKDTYIAVIDSATGECWYNDFSRSDASEWRSLGSPVKAK